MDWIDTEEVIEAGLYFVVVVIVLLGVMSSWFKERR